MDRCQIPAVARGQINRDLRYTHWGAKSSDVSGTSFVPAQLTRLLSVSLTNPHAASGQYLAALETLRSSLLQCQPQIRLESVFFRTELVSFGKSSMTVRLRPSITYSFDEAVQIINAASKQETRISDSQKEETIFLSVVELSVVEQTDRLLRKLDRRIRLVRRLVQCSISRFCALSWSRRLWYLLHGSHPPKTDCRLAFGCA